MKSTLLKKSTKKEKKTWADFELSEREKVGFVVNSFDSIGWDWNNKLPSKRHRMLEYS